MVKKKKKMKQNKWFLINISHIITEYSKKSLEEEKAEKRDDF